MMNKKYFKPELVSPAGDWPSLVAAVDAGADSVYFGIAGLNMREFADNFKIGELNKIISYLHKAGRKGYLALNVVVMNSELRKLEKILIAAKAAKVDAIVAWDMAVLSMAHKIGLTIHLSTQASVSNCRALEFFARLGVKRIVVARECSVKDLKAMLAYSRAKQLDCGLEVFIHGAMCVSLSGRCFLSLESFGQSANRGRCLQPCRRQYQIKEIDGDKEYILGNDYVLSPKDLCGIDFLDKFIKIGVTAFKIEGRKRSPEYVRVATSVYRQAIDAFFVGKLNGQLKKDLKQKLSAAYNRGFSSGFYLGQPRSWISRKLENKNEKIYLGEVTHFYSGLSVAEIIIHNGPLSVGQDLLVIGTATGVQFFKVEQLQQNNQFIEKAEKGQKVGIKIPFKVRVKDKVYVWKAKGGV
jgi:U32 family peptidase